MFIPEPWDPNFSILDPGYWIPDPGSRRFGIPETDPLQRIKELLTLKLFLSSRKNNLGHSSRSRILDPDFFPSQIPDPGVKKAPDPESATLKGKNILPNCYSYTFAVFFTRKRTEMGF
jgi:hypothetical protein